MANTCCGMKCCSPLKIVGIAILLTVIAYIVNTVVALLTMQYYFDPNYFAVWSKVMMPTAGPPPPEFTYISLLFGFIFALIYIWAYKFFEPGLEAGDGWMKKGLYYGIILFLIGSLPGMLSMYLLINLPATLIGWWMLSGLVIAMINGLVIAKLC